MIVSVFRLVGSARHRRWVEMLLACRALLFLGRRHICPCCGWRLRAFTHGGASLRVRRCGYCPRCNAKARHRRDWLYMAKHTDLFTAPHRLLHVGPKYALSRRFVRMKNIDYSALDCEPRPHVRVRADVTAIPYEAGSFEAIICIHVLEHVEDDRKAMREFCRVLEPGGWAFISVPLRLDATTYEDPSVVTPEARRRAFGEEQHVRVYGTDIAERLETCGFSVRLERGDRLDSTTRERYGLLEDENILFCRKEANS